VLFAKAALVVKAILVAKAFCAIQAALMARVI
jgi:hypothetical protein